MIYVCEYDDMLPWTVIEKEARRFGLVADSAEPAGYAGAGGGGGLAGTVDTVARMTGFPAAGTHLPEPVCKMQAPRLTQRQACLRERVMARLLLEYALQREYGLRSLEELAWQTGGKGKPYSAARPEIYFNMSHCETACACVTADREVGIDVERRFAFRPSLARRVCTEQERLLMERLSEAEQERLLQVLWSMKESYVKRDGRGLAYGLERIGLAAELVKLRGVWSVQENSDGLQEGRAGGFVVRVTPHYTLAVCGVQSDTAILEVGGQEFMRGERADDKTGI